MSSIIKHILIALPNVQRLTVLGDDRMEKFLDEIVRLCRGFTHLTELTLSPTAITTNLLSTLGSLPYLREIKVVEQDRIYDRKSMKTPDPAIQSRGITLRRNAYRSLKTIGLTASAGGSLRQLLSNRHFPARSLTTLWVRFNKGASFTPTDVQAVIQLIASQCPSLECLTVRFAPFDQFGLDHVRGVTGLNFIHIEPFLSLSMLREFTIDHTLPITLSNDNVSEIARRAASFRVLWLNPFPAITTALRYWDPPPLTCLRHFAYHCKSLRSIGLYVSASYPIEDDETTPTFRSLQEIFVGWSEIPITPLLVRMWPTATWEDIAVFLSRVLPVTATVTTPHHRWKSRDVPVSSSPMRPPFVAFEGNTKTMDRLCHAWSAVSGMAKFIRSNQTL